MGLPLLLFDNRFLDATPAATGTAAGFAVANVIDWRTYTFWRAAAAGVNNITVDCGAARLANTLGIIGHNLHTAAATVSVEHSMDNITYHTALAGFLPGNNRAILRIFAIQSARFWRLRINTATVIPQIAVLCIGMRLDFERMMRADGFDPFSEKIIAQSVQSKAGHLLGATTRYVEIEIRARWNAVSAAWIRDHFRPAWDRHLSRLFPFFWAWNIVGHPSEVYFVRIPDDYELKTPMIPGNPTHRSLELIFRGVKE